jgi:DNA-binding LacI/PurR family transcriptional regulator
MARSERPVGIRQVAERAGVSMSTVSLTINGRGRISESVRTRVYTAARELGYRPNPSAVKMRGRRSGIVGVVDRVPPDSSWRWDDLEFVVRLVRAVCTAACDQGWYPTLLPGHTPGVAFDGIPLDGVVVIDPLPADPHLRELDRLEISTVTMGRDITADAADWWADNDKVEQCRVAVDLLQSTGARRPLMLSALTGQSYMTDNVREFCALTEARRLDARVHEVPPSFSPVDCYQLIRAACTGPEPIDSVYIMVEALVQPALDAIMDAGLSVPHEVQVITASDSNASRGARIPVTSFDLDPEQLGNALIDLLRHRMDGLPGASTHTVPTRLLKRGSTR